MTTTNHYEERARIAKCISLVSAARKGGYSADDLADFGIEQWTLLSQIARVLYPSDVSKYMTIEILRGAEAERERDDADPFVGL